MIDDQQRDELLAKRPAVSVTKERIESVITSVEFERISDGTMTICVVTLRNGFQVVGKSACAHPENYNKDLGEKIAYDDAFRQIWPLEGYLLRESLYLFAQKPAPTDPAVGETTSDAA
ncbi:MAG: hypothetical protein BGO51_03735 [Rhodospirillales bacterium 69-11]|nr:hypothetical protein [Rhodospirillales bacterium]OJW28355.1 MAG: hypothetical protein BGO51_03735 [Rhodospirillales bacterium 69-11]